LQKDVRYRFQNAGDIRIELEEIGSKPEAVIAVAAGVLVAAMLAGAIRIGGKLLCGDFA